MMEYRNAKYNSVGTIDCEINHPKFGWIPFTASPDDSQKYGRDLYASMRDIANEYTPPPPPPPPTKDEVAAQVRSHRDALLSSSDWTQMQDAPVDRAAWAEYRQALRDVTDQEGFPENVTWPEPPK